MIRYKWISVHLSQLVLKYLTLVKHLGLLWTQYTEILHQLLLIMVKFPNGFIYPKCRIRQGCPISPYLHNMAVELLAISFREYSKIQGIKMGDLEIKLDQLADYITCFITSIDSIIGKINTFNIFKMCAG